MLSVQSGRHQQLRWDEADTLQNVTKLTALANLPCVRKVSRHAKFKIVPACCRILRCPYDVWLDSWMNFRSLPLFLGGSIDLIRPGSSSVGSQALQR